MFFGRILNSTDAVFSGVTSASRWYSGSCDSVVYWGSSSSSPEISSTCKKCIRRAKRQCLKRPTEPYRKRGL